MILSAPSSHERGIFVNLFGTFSVCEVLVIRYVSNFNDKDTVKYTFDLFIE